MEINWMGHACFSIKGSQTTIVTDPFSPNLGYSLDGLKANIVTISHQHQSHSFVQAVGGQPRVITGPGEYEINNVFILGVSTFHDQENGGQSGKNTLYVMEIDGVNICHLGDLGHVLTPAQVEEIDKVDILLIPVGGVATINASLAAQVVRQLEPKIVLPMHYQTSAVMDSQLEPVDRFLKEIGVNDIVPQPKLMVTKNNLPASTQVILLEYRH